MNQRIEVVLDEEGRLVLPSPLPAEMGLLEGTTLVVEKGEDGVAFLRVQTPSSIFADEGGVLVVTSPLVGDIESVIEEERENRVQTLLQRILL
jgi:bifunctional DNA-binding transcriptional regulator/antitoxin component of YhaV-PrlF toxin-antitoxin module